MIFKVSLHARERFTERGTHILKILAQQAFEKGVLLNDAEMKIMFEKGIEKDKYWMREYRKHMDLIWVYAPPQRGKMKLVTILPLL